MTLVSDLGPINAMIIIYGVDTQSDIVMELHHHSTYTYYFT